MNPWEQDEIVESNPTNPWEQDVEVGEQPTKEVMPYAREFAGGFNVGLTQMAGAPVDITNYLLSKIGIGKPDSPVGSRRNFGSEKPIGGSQHLQEQMSRGGDMFLEPQTKGTAGKIIRRAGQEVGASILPAGGLTKIATKTLPVYKTKSLIRKVLLDPIKRSPGKAAIGETVAATGAGVGGGIAEEQFPDSKVAETTSQLVGATAPSLLTLTPAGLVSKATRKVVSRFSKKAQQQQAEKIIRKTLGDELTDPAIKSLKETQSLRKKVQKAGIEDWDYSLAEGTGSPTLLRQQEHLETNASDVFLDKVTKRREINQQAIEKYSETLSPKSDLDAQYVINTAKGKIDVVGGRIEDDINRVIQKKQDTTNNIPTLDRMGSGQAIRDGISQAKTDASLKMSLRAEELGIANIDMSEAFKTFGKELADKYKPGSRFEDIKSMPGIYKQIIGDKGQITSKLLDKSGQPIKTSAKTTFNDIKAIRERISDDIINTLGAATPNRKKLRTLILMKKDIDNFLDVNAGSLGEQYKAFRKDYFENYIKPFESGAVFKSRNKDGTGFYRTNDEKVAELFLDNPSAAKQYNDMFSKNPEMMQNLEAATLDDLKRFATDDGVLNPNKFKAWLKRKGESLEQLQGIKQKVLNIDEAQKLLDKREGVLVGRKKSIEDLSLSKQLSKYGKYEITSDQIIDDALKKPGKMAQLDSFIKHDKDAGEALKRIIWNKATSGTSEDIIKFITTNDKSLSILFGKKHLRDMADISKMKLLGELIKPPTGKPMTGNELPEALKKIELMTGMKIPQYGTRLYAWKSGRVPKSYLAMEMMANSLRQAGIKHSEKIWKEALYDPELSSMIMKGILDGELTKQTASKIGGRVVALGLPYIEEQNDNNL